MTDFNRNGERSVAKSRHHDGKMRGAHMLSAAAPVIDGLRLCLTRIAYISLTMKIVRILGKVSDNLSLTCAKSTAQNQPRLQAALLASPQPR